MDKTVTTYKNVREWQAAYAAGEYNATDVDTQIAAGWYSWECDDSALAAKTKAMAGAVTRIKDGGKVDRDGMYIRFINAVEDNVSYDAFNLIYIDNMDRGFLCTSGQPLGDGKKWHVYETPNHREPIGAFSTVTQLAKWLSTPYDAVARWGEFSAPWDSSNDELKEIAAAQAMEDYGEEFTFDGVMRKTFRIDGEAQNWLAYQYGNLPARTVALAIYQVDGEKVGSGVYAVEP